MRGSDTFTSTAQAQPGPAIEDPKMYDGIKGEPKLVMGNCGTRTVADITRAHVAPPDWRA